MTELLIGAGDGKTAYMPNVREIEWQTQVSGSPGKLVCDIISDGTENILEGAPVSLKAEDRNIFFGYIFGREIRSKGILRLTCYDQMRYLLNKDTYIFENITASELIRLIAEDFSLKIGALTDSGYVIPYRVEENSTLLDMAENALTQTFLNNGKRFVMYDDFGRLCLKSITEMYGGGLIPVIDGETGESFSYTCTIDKGCYNKVKLTYNDRKSGKREIYSSADNTLIEKWGVLQYTGTIKNGENGRAKADSILKIYGRKNNSLKLTNAFGDVRFRGGCVALVKGNEALGTENRFMLANKVTHRFTAKGHFMDMLLSEIKL